MGLFVFNLRHSVIVIIVFCCCSIFLGMYQSLRQTFKSSETQNRVNISAFGPKLTFSANNESSKHTAEANKKRLEERYPYGGKNCVYDQLLRVDSTVLTIPRGIVCDVKNENYDVICRWFLTQAGFADHSECVLPKPSKTDDVVPKVVYYVTYGAEEWSFLAYLSVVSAWRYLRPWSLYVVGDQQPRGRWWRRTLQDVPGLRFVMRPPPRPAGVLPKHPEHSSDVVRLQLLLLNGGIYLDSDVIVIRPMDDLLRYDVSMGQLDGEKMGNAVILSKRASSFLHDWFLSYRRFGSFADVGWMSNDYFELSNRTPLRLWQRNRQAVHNIAETVYRPCWNESVRLFKGNDYPWQTRHSVHVWRHHPFAIPDDPKDIQRLNTTLGQLFRHVYFGNSAMLPSMS